MKKVSTRMIMLNTSDIGSNMAVRRNKMIGFDPLRCDISGYTTKGFFNIFELFSISVVKCYYASKWNKFSSTLTIIVDPYYSGHDTLNRVGHFTLGQFERDNFLQSWNDSFFYSFPLSLFFFFLNLESFPDFVLQFLHVYIILIWI